MLTGLVIEHMVNSACKHLAVKLTWLGRLVIPVERIRIEKYSAMNALFLTHPVHDVHRHSMGPITVMDGHKRQTSPACFKKTGKFTYHIKKPPTTYNYKNNEYYC